MSTLAFSQQETRSAVNDCRAFSFDPEKCQTPIDFNATAIPSKYSQKSTQQPEYMSISERKCFDVNPADIDFIKEYFNDLPDYLVGYFANKYVELFNAEGRQSANTFIRIRMGGTLRERVTAVLRKYSHLPTVNKVARVYENKNDVTYDEGPGQMTFDFEHTYKAIAKDKLLPSLSDEELKDMAFTISTIIMQFYKEQAAEYKNEDELDAAIPTVYQRVACMCNQFGLQAPKQKKKATPEEYVIGINTVSTDKWWLNGLKTAQKAMREHLSIAMGQVSDRASAYCSFDCVFNHQNQKKKNWDYIENHILEDDETGEQIEMKDMVVKSQSNPKLRRMELMTRIRGIENIGNELGLSGLFLTLTAPSKYHSVKHSSVGAGYFNENWNYASPRETQEYLNGVWGKIRTKLSNSELRWFGVRVAEPHHDGTPHWHMLLWCRPEDEKAIKKIFIHYATQVDKHELMKSGKFNPEPRCEIKPIDPEQGSATGYIAKYISKNIDGYGMDDEVSDESGKSMKYNAQHVSAWASRWRIRQFQFFGGAPITTYRELRRLANIDRAAFADYIYSLERGDLVRLFTDAFTQEYPEDFVGARFDVKRMTKDDLKNLLIKNYKIESREGEEQVIEAMVSADEGNVAGYNSAQGGMFVKRKNLLITNEYEIEPYAGVYCNTLRKLKGIKALGEVILTRVKKWTITQKSGAVGLSGDEIAPWSSVNNCTQEVMDKLRTPNNKYKEDGFNYPQLREFTELEVDLLMQGKRVLRDDGRLFKLEQRTQEQYELRELRPYTHKPTLDEVCEEFGFLDGPEIAESPPEKGQQIRNDNGELVGYWADNGTGTLEKHYQPDFRNELDINEWELI